MTADEERDLADRILAGDAAARERLVVANLGLVAPIARRLGSDKVPLADRVQEGNLGLMRAAEDFDPAMHGGRFADYAEVWIRAFIWRALVANSSLVRVPQHAYLKRKRAAQAGEPIPSVVPLEADPIDHRDPTDRVERHLLLEIALRRLNPVEAWVIRERYGLEPIPGRPTSGPPQVAHKAGTAASRNRTFADMGRDCGLSDRRLARVEKAAMLKLRRVLRHLAPAVA